MRKTLAGRAEGWAEKWVGFAAGAALKRQPGHFPSHNRHLERSEPAARIQKFPNRGRQPKTTHVIRSFPIYFWGVFGLAILGRVYSVLLHDHPPAIPTPSHFPAAHYRPTCLSRLTLQAERRGGEEPGQRWLESSPATNPDLGCTRRCPSSLGTSAHLEELDLPGSASACASGERPFRASRLALGASWARTCWRALVMSTACRGAVQISLFDRLPRPALETGREPRSPEAWRASHRQDDRLPRLYFCWRASAAAGPSSWPGICGWNLVRQRKEDSTAQTSIYSVERTLDPLLPPDHHTLSQAGRRPATPGMQVPDVGRGSIDSGLGVQR